MRTEESQEVSRHDSLTMSDAAATCILHCTKLENNIQVLTSVSGTVKLASLGDPWSVLF